jgi:dienelactone hydrolase
MAMHSALRTSLTVIAALLASAALGAAAARANGPAPELVIKASTQSAGEVETVLRDWTDASRARAVPVRLYLPVDAAKPAPLIVFSHGIGGSRNGYSYLGRFWASLGYASLHVQHVGSDRSLWAGSVFGLPGRMMEAAQDTEAIHRARDVSFALTQMLGGEFASRIDPARIVAAGHSYGANTTLLVAGAQVVRDGTLINLADPRIRAAMVLSAPPFYGEAEPKKILSHVRLPILHVTSTEDIIRVPGYFSGAEDRVKVFEDTGSEDKWLAVFEGGSHSIFTDRSGPGGPQFNAQIKSATQALSAAFLKAVFGGERSELVRWSEAYKPILARYQSAKQ